MTPLERENKALSAEIQHLRSELDTQSTELQHARKALGAAERAGDVQAHELAARRQAIAELQASARDDEMWRRQMESRLMSLEQEVADLRAEKVRGLLQRLRCGWYRLISDDPHSCPHTTARLLVRQQARVEVLQGSVNAAVEGASTSGVGGGGAGQISSEKLAALVQEAAATIVNEPPSAQVLCFFQLLLSLLRLYF